jgi:hypothetical protein
MCFFSGIKRLHESRSVFVQCDSGDLVSLMDVASSKEVKHLALMCDGDGRRLGLVIIHPTPPDEQTVLFKAAISAYHAMLALGEKCVVMDFVMNKYVLA